MERKVLLRHRATGLYVTAGPIGVTPDPVGALRFPDPEAARRFAARHACERDALEVIERPVPAAA